MLRLLDTTVLIDALRGRSAADRLRELTRRGAAYCTSAINAEELARGVRPSDRAVTDTMLDAIAIIDIGLAEARAAGTWRREFAAAGVTLHQADCLIAAAAWSCDAVLATGNPKHFPMPDVLVEHWPVGE